jgi:hypothetical protein
MIDSIIAHQPVEQVDIVNGLVHERAAAVEVPGAPPAARIVVLLGSPPLHVRVAQRQAAEPAPRDGLLEPQVRGAEARGEDGAELNPGSSAGVDDGVAAPKGDLQRLLNHDVLARPRRLYGRIQVGAAGRADADDVQLRERQHFGEIVEDPATMPRHPGDLLGIGLGAAVGGDDTRARDLIDGPGVELGNHPAADDAEAVLGHGYVQGVRVLARSSDQAHSCDLALAHADDQAVGHVHKGLGISDDLALGTDVETSLFDHPAGVRPAGLEL